MILAEEGKMPRYVMVSRVEYMTCTLWLRYMYSGYMDTIKGYIQDMHSIQGYMFKV